LSVLSDVSLLSDDDLYLFNEGSHYRLYDKLGSHLMKVGDVSGCYFAVWAPNAQSVSVSGDWNGWNREANQLHPKGQSGIWEGFIPDVGQGAIYKYHVVAKGGAYRVDKADPYAVHQETPPKTGSIVWDLA
jgi:1,4-alpha-glucan branching enzyme